MHSLLIFPQPRGAVPCLSTLVGLGLCPDPPLTYVVLVTLPFSGPEPIQLSLPVKKWCNEQNRCQ